MMKKDDLYRLGHIRGVAMGKRMAYEQMEKAVDRWISGDEATVDASADTWSFKGRVSDAGGGVVDVMVDRDTPDYPIVGSFVEVIVSTPKLFQVSDDVSVAGSHFNCRVCDEGPTRIYDVRLCDMHAEDLKHEAPFRGPFATGNAPTPLTELEQVTRRLHLQLERTGWCWYCGYKPTHVEGCPVQAVAVSLAKLQASGVRAGTDS